MLEKTSQLQSERLMIALIFRMIRHLGKLLKGIVYKIMGAIIDHVVQCLVSLVKLKITDFCDEINQSNRISTLKCGLNYNLSYDKS